jgi:hypothetical protein
MHYHPLLWEPEFCKGVGGCTYFIYVSFYTFISDFLQRKLAQLYENFGTDSTVNVNFLREQQCYLVIALHLRIDKEFRNQFYVSKYCGRFEVACQFYRKYHLINECAVRIYFPRDERKTISHKPCSCRFNPASCKDIERFTGGLPLKILLL